MHMNIMGVEFIAQTDSSSINLNDTSNSNQVHTGSPNERVLVDHHGNLKSGGVSAASSVNSNTSGNTSATYTSATTATTESTVPMAGIGITTTTTTTTNNNVNVEKGPGAMASDKASNDAPNMVNDDYNHNHNKMNRASAQPSQELLSIPNVTKLDNAMSTTPPESPSSTTGKNQSGNNGDDGANDGVKMTITDQGKDAVTDDQVKNGGTKTSKASSSSSSHPPVKKTRKLNYIPSKLGRKGDPRMHKALRARLDNPKISLLDALTQGGFEFEWKDGISYDKDNVQLGQRKNQLSRRLRLHRQNHKSKDPPLPLKEESATTTTSNSYNAISDGKSPPQSSPGSTSSKRKRDDGNNTLPSTTGSPSPPKSINSGATNELTAVTSTIPNLLQHQSQSGQGFHQPQSQSLLKQDQVGGTPGELLQYNDQHLLLSSYFSNNASSSSAMGTAGTGTTGLGGTSNPSNNTSSISKGDFYQYQESLNGNTGGLTSNTSGSMPGILTMNNDMNSSSQSTITGSIHQDEKLEKLHQALNLFRFDSSALMKRCMLTAGFSHQETEECDEMYLLFGDVALENEKKRLDRIRFRMNRRPLPGQPQVHCHHRQTDSLLANTAPNVGCTITNTSSFQPETRTKTNDLSVQNSMNGQQQARGMFHLAGDDTNSRSKTNDMRVQNSMNGQPSQESNQIYYDNTSNKASSQIPQKTTCNHDHNHNHSHARSRSRSQSMDKRVVCNNPHLHRLEGKCGHKAVIHRPADGSAHIDFVVDGKVECYEDCQPMMDSSIFWLSKFKCDKKHENGSKQGDSDSVQNCLQNIPDILPNPNAVPKILDIDEIDFESEEWREMRDILDNNDSNNGLDPLMDEQVLGSLFKLGERN